MGEPHLCVHKYETSPLVFPSEEIKELLKHFFSDGSDLVQLPEGEMLMMEAPDVYFLIDGVMEVRHANNKAVIGVLDSAFPLGLMESYYSCNILGYKAKSPCSLLRVNKAIWDATIQNEALGKYVFIIISYAFFAMVKYCNDVLSETTYRKIRRLLYLYERRKNLFIRTGETITSYILARVPISKSQVMKVLSELKKGDYIHIERGYLLAINRRLPADY